MNKSDKDKLWFLAFAALGITTVSLYLGLKQFLWRLWAVLSFLWCSFWVIVAVIVDHDMSDDSFWILTFVPPLLLLLIAALLSWVINGIHHELEGKELERKEMRKKLGYDD